MDHQAIRKAYPTVVTISVDKAYDKDYKEVTLVQSEIDAARTELNTEAAKVKYKTDRAKAYPSIEDQLDMQYWDKVNGTTKWQEAIAKVKSDYPKPS